MAGSRRRGLEVGVGGSLLWEALQELPRAIPEGAIMPHQLIPQQMVPTRWSGSHGAARLRVRAAVPEERIPEDVERMGSS